MPFHKNIARFFTGAKAVIFFVPKNFPAGALDQNIFALHMRFSTGKNIVSFPETHPLTGIKADTNSPQGELVRSVLAPLVERIQLSLVWVCNAWHTRAVTGGMVRNGSQAYFFPSPVQD